MMRCALGRRLRAALIVASLGIGLPAMTRAQSQPLPARLAPSSRDAIERLADSLRSSGVPASPLYDKAAEGVLKGADDARILAAVRALARDLQDVRVALGPTASLNELVSGASALRAGVPITALQRVRARPGGAPLALSYIVLADLVARGVPASAAVTSLESLLAHGAGDVELTAFRSGVERDLLAGRDPASATSARAQGIARQLTPRAPRVP